MVKLSDWILPRRWGTVKFMGKRKQDDGGFAMAEALLVLIIIAIVGFVAWFVVQAKHDADKNLNADKTSQASGKTGGSDNASLQYDLNGINGANNQISSDLTTSDASLNDNSTFTSLP